MTVHVVEGEVVILGPDGISVSITPEASAESGRRLLEASQKAIALTRVRSDAD